ncbi:hypothetical protein ACFVWR_06320 [Leifsonia sp. NPDC058292]|uniref:hypothetical protein n=1 Tax=Leifsonia sp. NPDC058292 TaxID=3346428 RepID=UPI0036D894C8
MFGRRRHAAAVPAAPVPQLSEAQILDVVHEKVAELIGERGEWTVSRRSQDDTDTIFHSVLAQSVSLSITTALLEAKRRIEAGELAESSEREPLHAAAVAEPADAASAEPVLDAEVTAPEADSETVQEPAAFGWEPAPITVWTDLRKPVTGEIPAIAQRTPAQRTAA